MAEKRRRISKRLTIIIVAIILSLVAISGFTIAFLINYNAFEPHKPIELDDGKNIYIMSEVNDSYRGYRFKFVDVESKEDIIIDSEKSNVISSLEVVDALSNKYGDDKEYIGREYEVTTCYLGEKAGNNSEYSKPLRWTLSVYLTNPTYYYDNISEVVEWNNVEHADYYKVFVNGDEDGIIVRENHLSVQNIGIGEKTISILAYSDNNGYKTKQEFKNELITFVHYLPVFSDLSFDKSTKTLTAYANEQIDKVEIILNERHEVSQFEVQQEEEKFKYTFNLSFIYKDEETIGIVAKSDNQYLKLKTDCERYINVNNQ